MSYDINFWKQDRPLEISAQDIYERLSSGKPVEGLTKLPVDEILTKLRDAFPDFDPDEQFPLVSIDDGSIEIAWSDQHFRFDLRGEVGAEHKNRLVHIMATHGCPMYDPQIGERYDAEEGVGLSNLPSFEDPSPEQRAEIEKIKKQFMEQIERGSGPKGCRRSVAFLAICVVLFLLLALRALAG